MMLMLRRKMMLWMMLPWRISLGAVHLQHFALGGIMVIAM